MSKIVVIHQPDFIPYLGFFHRLLYADEFVILDDVQFIKRGWQHRDKIKTPKGDIWVSLQIKKAPTNTNINEIELAMDKKAKNKLLCQILENYRKSKYFKEIEPFVENFILSDETNLAKFNINIIKRLIKIFDINVDIIIASSLNHKYKGNEMNADILQKRSATHYLSGIGAKNYFDPIPFNKANVKVIWQNFFHPTYPQLYGEFIPYLSSIDLLFNCGIEKSKEILRSIK